jgi:cytochrome P450
VPKLVYTNAVLHEALRVYPPVWALARMAAEDDVLDGVRIPKGSLVFFLPWLIHRRGDVWADADKFDPSRWLPDSPRPKSRCAFMPFSSGPRKCIGDGFALLEGQLVLATLLQRVKLELAADQRIAPEPVFTLRPRHGVMVQAHAPATQNRSSRQPAPGA